jgi:integrase/recombinase XerC
MSSTVYQQTGVRLDQIPQEAFGAWLASGRSVQAQYSALTLRRYRQVVSDFMAYAKQAGITCLAEINLAWVRAYLNQPQTAAQADRSRKASSAGRFSASSKIVAQSALNLYWYWAMAQDYAIDNPVEQLTAERARERSQIGRGGRKAGRLPKVLSWAQQEMLCDVVLANPRAETRARDHALIQLLLTTGLRCEEVCHLPMLALDMASGRLRVIGKGDKERIIQFKVEEVRPALEAWCALRTSVLQASGSASPALFVTRNGKPMTPQGVYQTVAGYLTKLKIQIGDEMSGNQQIIAHLGPHLLRHTAASRMLAQGVPLMQAMANLGHSDLATFQIYAHLLPAR